MARKCKCVAARSPSTLGLWWQLGMIQMRLNLCPLSVQDVSLISTLCIWIVMTLTRQATGGMWSRLFPLYVVAEHLAEPFFSS